jgi:hypothetical protein
MLLIQNAAAIRALTALTEAAEAGGEGWRAPEGALGPVQLR